MASFTLSTFLCVAVLSGMIFAETEFCQGPCPGGWTYHNHRCFQYFSEEANWIDAEVDCVHHGGNLASEHSEDDHAFLKELQSHNGDSAKPFWIGLSDVHKEGTWLWSDGKSFKFTKWNSGEPNNLNDENCVHSNFGGQKDWNDIQCTRGYPYICSLHF